MLASLSSPLPPPALANRPQTAHTVHTHVWGQSFDLLLVLAVCRWGNLAADPNRAVNCVVAAAECIFLAACTYHLTARFRVPCWAKECGLSYANVTVSKVEPGGVVQCVQACTHGLIVAGRVPCWSHCGKLMWFVSGPLLEAPADAVIIGVEYDCLCVKLHVIPPATVQ